MAFALQGEFGVVKNVDDSAGLFGSAMKTALASLRQIPNLDFAQQNLRRTDQLLMMSSEVSRRSHGHRFTRRWPTTKITRKR